MDICCQFLSPNNASRFSIGDQCCWTAIMASCIATNPALPSLNFTYTTVTSLFIYLKESQTLILNLFRYIELNHTNSALLLHQATQKYQKLTDY